jgi:hypothetical protein
MYRSSWLARGQHPLVSKLSLHQLCSPGSIYPFLLERSPSPSLARQPHGLHTMFHDWLAYSRSRVRSAAGHQHRRGQAVPRWRLVLRALSPQRIAPAFRYLCRFSLCNKISAALPSLVLGSCRFQAPEVVPSVASSTFQRATSGQCRAPPSGTLIRYAV